MHAGNGQLHQINKSRQLQRKLYLAAKKCRERRFHALYDRIFRPDVLWRAWQEMKANGGSAGVDGVSLEEVERQGEASGFAVAVGFGDGLQGKGAGPTNNLPSSSRAQTPAPKIPVSARLRWAAPP